MHAIAVEKFAPQAKGPLETPSRILPPAISFLLRWARQHFMLLLFILMANFGWGFILDHYDPVYSTLGVVHGAGYAAAHITRVALWVMTASALACVLLAIGFFRTRTKHIVTGIVVYAALYVIAVMALPRLFETFMVKPNELSLEMPYFNHYIAFTRKAYKLDEIQETAYPERKQEASRFK